MYVHVYKQINYGMYKNIKNAQKDWKKKAQQASEKDDKREDC